MCEGILNNSWNLRHHFQDVHPMDLVMVPSEGKYWHCHQCGMQVNPFYPQHYTPKECPIGVERKQQQEAGVTSALALRQRFLFMGMCWSGWKYLSILGGCLPRMMMTSRHSVLSCGKPGPLGLLSGRYFGARMPPHTPWRTSIGRGAGRATLW